MSTTKEGASLSRNSEHVRKKSEKVFFVITFDFFKAKLFSESAFQKITFGGLI
jgi:hypothetical protein